MHTSTRNLLAVALIGGVALVGCKKDEPAVAPPAATPPAAAEPAAPLPSATDTARVSIVSVDLGTNVGTDQKISTPTTSFAPNDTIIASVSTNAAGNEPVTGNLHAKWTFQDGQTVHEETTAINFTGPGTTNFQISQPGGLPAGRYSVDISLDGASNRKVDFEVK
ncbi:hypothetical protein LDO26_06450 [Luteimonas sp. BDR2-5]|uniref:hypothetical protein n=1 Tax=Proluteimonas luteida TaxID=2878685 RepID=UPI001E4F2CD3|nr:hypothetical protein [Luteimonas sp. BDR2-5]MCD9027843.1 hypothetical protein [Luteimonas sp. BDR2-5]